MWDIVKNVGANLCKGAGVLLAGTTAFVVGTGGTNGGLNLGKKLTGAKINGKVQLGLALAGGAITAGAIVIGLTKKSSTNEKPIEEPQPVETEDETDE